MDLKGGVIEDELHGAIENAVNELLALEAQALVELGAVDHEHVHP